MVDIEPMLEYKTYTFGLHTIYNILAFGYLAFIIPLYTILNYNVKTEKEAIQELVLKNLGFCKSHLHKVSKKGLIVEKDVMYFSNHLSCGDFFIDPYVVNYNGKFISLSKIKLLLPLLGLMTSCVNSVIFIDNMKDKNQIIEKMNHIEKLRKADTKRNILVYPEGMRRPHRPNVSQILKKGFIYHSFENNLPIQIIHTTNKDYIMDDEKFSYNTGIHAFTYYSPKIDPQKLKLRYEKKYKKEYTKDDYYEDVYKEWCKIWKKMDKYRIDSYMEKGVSYEDALKTIEALSIKFPIIENKIVNGDKPVSNLFILLRSVCWAIIYYIIFKIIEKAFEVFFSFSKKTSQTSNVASTLCSKFSFLKNFLFSRKSSVSSVSPVSYISHVCHVSPIK